MRVSEEQRYLVTLSKSQMIDLKMAGGKQSVLVTSSGDGTAGKKRRHKKLH